MRTELEGLITYSSSLVELQEKELDKIIATVTDIKASFEDSIQKSEWQKTLNILNQEIENNKKSLRLVSNNKVDICVLVRLTLRYLQAEKPTLKLHIYFLPNASSNA